ncbi:hypothetical protein LXM25_24680 [Dyadobacter sp. LJ53]|uniref:hypothetical protein n=1 Tax=Dyadobacter chenwenxiniae TaxID=2906456 RepID=UPI001F39AF74|nr:hypothetical protein [Dyadobacter chenwenxiniae]MCF0053289.1 hypothetical protein [Dyadobacter chenwenxiniae]
MISASEKFRGSSKLNDMQISLLRLFEQGISEADELEVRKMLMDYFNQGLQKEIEEVLKKKEYSTQDYHKMLSDDNFKSK